MSDIEAGVATVSCYTELPESFRQCWEDHEVKIIEDFAMQHQGNVMFLRCREHDEEIAFLKIPAEYTRTFCTTAEGVELNFHDLVRLPNNMVINVGAEWGTSPKCRTCSKELTLFNPMLDAMESFAEMRDMQGFVNANFPNAAIQLHLQPAHRRDFVKSCRCMCGQAADQYKCGGCNSVRFCSTGCQQQHWEAHRPVCKYMRCIQGVRRS